MHATPSVGVLTHSYNWDVCFSSSSLWFGYVYWSSWPTPISCFANPSFAHESKINLGLLLDIRAMSTLASSPLSCQSRGSPTSSPAEALQQGWAPRHERQFRRLAFSTIHTGTKYHQDSQHSMIFFFPISGITLHLSGLSYVDYGVIQTRSSAEDLGSWTERVLFVFPGSTVRESLRGPRNTTARKSGCCTRRLLSARL